MFLVKRIFIKQT